MALHTPTSERFILDLPTALCLGLVFSFVPLAQISASIFLPKSKAITTRTLYWLYIWCAFDVLTHSIVEGSYLYHCFFSYMKLAVPHASSDYPHPASLGSRSTSSGLLLPGPFLGYNDRSYGSFYSTGAMARLWREYAKADRRWGGADPTIISLELLTVFGAGPLALYICVLITKITNLAANASSLSATSTKTLTSEQAARKARLEAKLWFTAIVLSTAELYGGFITFAPEWLTGSTLLVTDDFVYLWLYLFFFNTLWVFIPFWILWVSWRELRSGFVRGGLASAVQKKNL